MGLPLLFGVLGAFSFYRFTAYLEPSDGSIAVGFLAPQLPPCCGVESLNCRYGRVICIS